MQSTQLRMQEAKWVPRVLSAGLKQSTLEPAHLPIISAEVKKTMIHTFTSPYVFMAQCIV
jgi:hypothetical protein